MRFITFALFCLALAQTPPPLTADEAVARALKQNPRLSAAAREIAAAQAGVRAARALTNPSLTFTPSVLGTGGADEEFLFQQPLELNGTRSARTGVAAAQFRQSQAEAVVELRTLVFETRTAYYELARARELRGVAEQALRTAEEFERITRRQVEVGTRPGLDLTQVGIETTRARQQLTLADSRVEAAAAVLNTVLGQPAAASVGDLSPLAFTPAPVDSAAAVESALRNRAEISAEEARREAFQQEARLARAQGRPDLTPQLRAGSVTRGLSDYGVGLGITLPFLDWGGRKNRVRQAEESARAQADRVTARRNQVGQEVAQATARLQAAERVVRDYQLGVLDQARTVVEASRRGLEAGLTTVVQVLEAQRTYRTVLAEYTNALADYALAQAELERATGAVPAASLPANPERSAK